MNDKKIPPAVAEYAVMEINKEKSMVCSERGKTAITRDYLSKSAGEAWLWQDLRSKYGDESAAEEGFYAGWQAALKQPSASVDGGWRPVPVELLYAITDPSKHGYDAVVTAIEILRALLNGGRS